MTAGVVRLKV